MKQDNMNEYSLPFAAWELRLYLDTNPHDERALNEYRRLCASMGDKCGYACHTPDARSGSHSHGNDARVVGRDNGCGCGNDARVMGRDNGCGCGNDARVMGRDNGCGCGNDARVNNGGGGNYGGNRNDSGNYSSKRGTNGSCGCGDNDNDSTVGNVWSWIDGPWPWEPEANGGDC